MLTDVQMTALAAAIRAETDPAIVAARTPETFNSQTIADFYNAASTVYVWRSNVPVAEYRDALVWTEVDSLTAGAARIFAWLTGNLTLPIDASKAAVRQGLADAFGPATSSRAALVAIGKRLATRCEALFVTGAGDGSNGSPKDLAFEGSVSYTDIGNALRLNP